jgi:hypothetical protein
MVCRLNIVTEYLILRPLRVENPGEMLGARLKPNGVRIFLGLVLFWYLLNA